MKKEYETPSLLWISVMDPDILSLSDDLNDGWTKLY